MKNTAFILICLASLCFSACHAHRAVIAPIGQLDTMAVDSSILGYVSPLNNVNKQLALYQDGVRYYAFSSWGNWSLEIRPGRSLEFINSMYETHSFPFVPAAIAQDANVINYRSVNATKEILSVTIHQQPLTTCEDEKGAVRYPFSVTVIFTDKQGKETVLSGCGFYLVNPILNDIWALESINGKPINTTAYTNGVPVLEFHMDGMRLHGFGGCNQLNGSFYVDQEKLVFSSMISTLKMCENMQAEIDFLNAVNNKSYAYTIENLRLTLTHKNGAVLTFKKVD